MLRRALDVLSWRTDTPDLVKEIQIFISNSVVVDPGCGDAATFVTTMKRNEAEGLNDLVMKNRLMAEGNELLRKDFEKVRFERDSAREQLDEAKRHLQKSLSVLVSIPVLTNAMKAICARLVKLLDLLDKGEKPTSEEIAGLRTLAKSMS